MNRPESTVVFCAVGPALDRIRSEFPEVDVIDITDGVPEGVSGQVLFGGMGRPSLEAMGRGVRWVQMAGTGIDHIAPEILAAEKVTSARGASATAISEYVIATIAAFCRGFPDNWIHEPPSRWNYQPGHLMAGSSVALFGFGGIAQRVARLALALDMSVRAQRRSTGPSPVPGVEMVHSFGDLVDDADHLVLAAPATPETHHIVNAGTLLTVKRGLHLVNIARGALVDQEALRAALDDGTLARASLDVVDPEPLPAGHWMYGHPKVFLTPHSSWVGPPMMSGATDIFCKNLRRYLCGEPLLHIVHDGY